MFHPQEYLRVGTVQKPHGHEGAVKIAAASGVLDFMENTFNQGNRFIFIEIMKKPVPFFIEAFTRAGEELAIIKWEDIDSPEAATKLRSHALLLPIAGLPDHLQKEPDNYDLAGFHVLNSQGEDVGVVIEVIENPLNSLLRVMKEDRELLLPLHEDFIVEVNLKEKILVVDYPDELLDLNHAEKA